LPNLIYIYTLKRKKGKLKKIDFRVIHSVFVNFTIKRKGGIIMNERVLVGVILAMVVGGCSSVRTQQLVREEPSKTLLVPQTEDFFISGRGDASGWLKATWEQLNLRNTDGHQYGTRIKMLYSNSGLYILMEAEDRTLTAKMNEDFLDLWNEDVFEFFLWPDERYPVYFEYEISPLAFELPILIPNFGGEFLGWRPWHYEGKRKTQKATTVVGGLKQSGAQITSWKAEVFVPYDLLKPLQNVPPKPQTRWRANFYRVDYDEGKTTSWDWARVGSSFHEFEKFGTLIFE
jgi:hypothetical protein